jgi:hypothetical protein
MREHSSAHVHPLEHVRPLSRTAAPGTHDDDAVPEVFALRAVGDDDLLARLTALVRQSRHVEADLVAHISEVDERRLYA